MLFEAYEALHAVKESSIYLKSEFKCLYFICNPHDGTEGKYLVGTRREVRKIGACGVGHAHPLNNQMITMICWEKSPSTKTAMPLTVTSHLVELALHSQVPNKRGGF